MKLVGSHPLKSVVFDGFECSARPPTSVDIQLHSPTRGCLRDSSLDEVQHLDPNAQLFFDLAHETLFCRFACLDLAARELPLSGESHFGPAARGEDSAVVSDNRGSHDFNDRVRLHRILPMEDLPDRHRLWRDEDSMKHILPDDIPPPRGLDELVGLLDGMRVALLTGAGCSTESGIPDYRGPITIKRERTPITYQEFVRDEMARRRYWSRSVLGWPKIRRTRPNETHRHITRLESAGLVTGLITQNVDGLHGDAGSANVVELHGSLAEVVCLGCGAIRSRGELQDELEATNAEWLEVHHDSGQAPDGDARVAREASREFEYPDCRCGGILKPNVVFFGENVPRAVVDRAWRIYDEADLLWVVGSSLTVYSGYRFVRRAASERKPVAIANLGETRGDEHAWSICRGLTSEILARVCSQLLDEDS